mmetsp:Transcript_4030/g.4121  ORF Transcript_4030/g.4121 Transcript_4030/m.4121 type:complete len:256 (-) Transcript_4030:200-967(-)
MYDPSQPPLISETLLKKRRSLDELAYIRSTTLQRQNKKKRVIRGENIKIKRPEQYVKEFRTRDSSKKMLNRRKREFSRRTVNFGVPRAEIRSTVGFIIRVHECRHTSKEVTNSLRELKLFHIHDAVFTKLDEPRIKYLKTLEPYIAYGYISFKAVSELIHRRTFIQEKGVRKPLTDNLMIEKILGKKNILCCNDLASHIYSIGEHFNDCLKLLSTYQLSSPVSDYEKKYLNMKDEIEARGGYLGDKMEEFLKKIL